MKETSGLQDKMNALLALIPAIDKLPPTFRRLVLEDYLVGRYTPEQYFSYHWLEGLSEDETLDALFIFAKSVHESIQNV